MLFRSEGRWSRRQTSARPGRELVGRTAGDLIVSIPLDPNGSETPSRAVPGEILTVEVVSAAPLLLQGRVVKAPSRTSEAGFCV